LDRVVAAGPALSLFTDLTGNGWMITKYDAFNRAVLTAWVPATVTSDTRKTLQDAINAATVLSESKTTADNTINGVAFRYSNAAWPTAGYHVLTVNYFDEYDFPTDPYLSTDLLYYPVYYNFTVKPKGLATGSWVRVLETSTVSNAEKSYVLYDNKGRAVRNVTYNHLGGYTRVDNELDFIGKVLYTHTSHRRLSTSPEITISDDFTYDHGDRLLKHTQRVGNNAQLIAKNTYNELGQLISKNVGGTDVTGNTGLQKVDYNYNIRGWLKGINDTNNLVQGSDPQDLFSFKLSYNDPTGATPLYNGNISETFWRTGGEDVLKKYSYSYDNVNRLLNASYSKPFNPLTPDNYNESMAYDKNGNITNLTRYGGADSNGSRKLIDQLVYTYDSNDKNRLVKVLDQALNPLGFNESNDRDSNGTTDVGNDYSYDLNGNMTTDSNKGITDIVYNHLNLPISISFGPLGGIQYTYNAAGKKMQKRLLARNAPSKITDYLDGFQYENNVLQFFPHAEGYVTNKDGAYSYAFNYTDHLGNVRLTYTGKQDPQTDVATLEAANQVSESSKFLRYNQVRLVSSPLFDHTNDNKRPFSNTMLAKGSLDVNTRLARPSDFGNAIRLSGSANEKTGLVKSLAVVPGDTIDMAVYAKYVDLNKDNWSTALAMLLNGIATGTAPAGTVIDGTGYSTSGATPFAFTGLNNTSNSDGTGPKAYLNYLVFDKDFKLIPAKSGYQRLSSAAKENGQNIAHELLSASVNITEAGYVYIYLSNESDTPVEVYFDDFRVTHKKSQVIASNDYYPFGLTFNSYTRENSVPNKYQYNGKELQDEMGLNMTAMDFRQYDNALGRFIGMDRLSEFTHSITPYRFALNNPNYFNDPSGLSERGSDGLTDYYHDPNGNVYFDPRVHGPDDVPSGMTYIGPTYTDPNTGTFWDENGVPTYQLEEVVVKRTIKSRSTTDYHDISMRFRKYSGYAMTLQKPLEVAFTGGSRYASQFYSAHTSNVVYKTLKGRIQIPLGNYNTATIGKLSKALKITGKTLGVVAVVSGGVSIYNDGLNISNGLDTSMALLALSPTGVGQAIAATYFILNTVSTLTTGKDIGQHIQEQIDEE
jgi:RHS repeat-associated protein